MVPKIVVLVIWRMAEAGLACEVLCKLSGMAFIMRGILCPNITAAYFLDPAPVFLPFEPVGRWFESHDSRVRLLSSEGVACPEGSSSESEGEGGSDEEVNPLLLDPTQWKVSGSAPRTCRHVMHGGDSV